MGNALSNSLIMQNIRFWLDVFLICAIISIVLVSLTELVNDGHQQKMNRRCLQQIHQSIVINLRDDDDEPLGENDFENGFHCIICYEMKPTVASTCCNRKILCQGCTQIWYKNNKHTHCLNCDQTVKELNCI